MRKYLLQFLINETNVYAHRHIISVGVVDYISIEI